MRKLGWFTVGFTYFLMVWGNLVSATGSGMGCRDEWPKCHGTFFPPISFEVVLEWGHRLLALITTILILATVIKILKASGEYGSALKRSGRSLLALLAVQILLGAATVILGLSITVSTIHLIIANLVFGGMITVASVMTWGNPVVSGSSTQLKRLAVAALGGLLMQLALGALVRHSHSGLACPTFPDCLDGFWPIPLTFSTAIAFLHRWWGIALTGHFTHMAFVANKECPSLKAVAWVSVLLSLVQIALGIVTVLSGIGTVPRAVHAAVGYGLWALLFFIAIRSGAFRFLWHSEHHAMRPSLT